MIRPKLMAVTAVVLLLLNGCGNPAAGLSADERIELSYYGEKVSAFMKGDRGDEFSALYEELLETGDSETEDQARKLLGDYLVSFAGAVSSSKSEADHFTLIVKEFAEDVDFFSVDSMADLSDELDGLR